jgi:hypothetical protein
MVEPGDRSVILLPLGVSRALARSISSRPLILCTQFLLGEEEEARCSKRSSAGVGNIQDTTGTPTHDRSRRATRTTRIIAARECASRARIARNSLFSHRNDLCPSFDLLARRSALDSCPILRATSCCLQFCSVSAMTPSAHPSRPRSKLQPRVRRAPRPSRAPLCALLARLRRRLRQR